MSKIFLPIDASIDDGNKLINIINDLIERLGEHLDTIGRRSEENITSIIQRSDLIDRARPPSLSTSLMAAAWHAQPASGGAGPRLRVFCRHRQGPGVPFPRGGSVLKL